MRPPNVDWCEQELCSWVVNPADTWSNLAYVAFGLWMMWSARGRGDGAAMFGPAAIVVGLCSGAYHASYTYLLQLLDFLGMYLFVGLLLTLNAERLGWIGARARRRVLLGGVAGLMALTPIVFETGFPIQSIVFVLILLTVGQEVVLARRTRAEDRPAYGLFLAALALITVAAGFSAADVTRMWCEPDNHWLQGHAIWHVLSATALAVLFLFHSGLAASASDA